MTGSTPLVPVTRSSRTSAEYDHTGSVFVAVPVHLTDAAVVDSDGTGGHQLLLRPVIRLMRAGLSPGAIADLMQMDHRVIKMVVADALDLGVTELETPQRDNDEYAHAQWYSAQGLCRSSQPRPLALPATPFLAGNCSSPKPRSRISAAG